MLFGWKIFSFHILLLMTYMRSDWYRYCSEQRLIKTIGCSQTHHAGYQNRKPLPGPEYCFANCLMTALFCVWRKQPSSVLFLHKEVKINAECVINLWTMSAAQDVCLALNFTLMPPEHLRYRSLALWLHRVLQRSGLYFIRHNIPCPFSGDTRVQDKDIGRVFIRTAQNRGCELQQRQRLTYRKAGEQPEVKKPKKTLKPVPVPCSQRQCFFAECFSCVRQDFFWPGQRQPWWDRERLAWNSFPVAGRGQCGRPRKKKNTIEFWDLQ